MATLIKIGNSQGIRIPKPIIKQAEVRQEGLLLKPMKKSIRENWEKNIKDTLSKNKNLKDEGLLEDFLEEDLDSWEW